MQGVSPQKLQIIYVNKEESNIYTEEKDEVVEDRRMKASKQSNFTI
jgi:hypothetical protein